MTDLYIMNLQRFADGAQNTQLTTSSGLSVEMKTYYEKTLLKNAQSNLVHSQFGDRYPIPAHGGKTIELRKVTPLAKALTPITEATMPAGNSLTVTNLTATVAQYGDFISQSDMLELTALDNTILMATEAQGIQAGETLDTIAREELNGGSNAIYAPKVSSGSETAVSYRHILDKTAKLTTDVVFTAVAMLKTVNCPKIDGGYVAIIHPHTERDVLADKEGFVPVVQYGRPESIYEGEIGRIGNCRFVVSSEAKIFYGEDLTAGARTLTVKTAITSPASDTIAVNEVITSADATALVGRDVIIGTNVYTIASASAAAAGSATITIDTAIAVAKDVVIYPGEGASAGMAAYSTLVMGANAYAVTEIEGGGLEHIVKQKGYADALNLRSATGWKCTNVVKRLDETRIVRVEHCTSFSDKVTAAN